MADGLCCRKMPAFKAGLFLTFTGTNTIPARQSPYMKIKPRQSLGDKKATRVPGAIPMSWIFAAIR
jgi:hypothetical protein